MSDQRGAEEVFTEPCSICDGQGCEEGCGRCEFAHAGPDSHKVCRSCGGSGRQGLTRSTEGKRSYLGTISGFQ